MFTTERGHTERGVKVSTSWENPEKPCGEANPSYTSYSEDKKLIIPGKTDDDKSFMMRFTKNTVILSIFNETIVFQKTSRGKTYQDSRFPGKRFSEDEIEYELKRMLGSAEGCRAMNELKW